MAQTVPIIHLSNSQVLKGTNYSAWKTKIRAILEFEGLWDIVDGIEKRPKIVGDQQHEFDQCNRKACMILLGISNDVQPHVRDSKDVAEACKELKQMFESKNQNQIHLQG